MCYAVKVISVSEKGKHSTADILEVDHGAKHSVTNDIIRLDRKDRCTARLDGLGTRMIVIQF